MKRSKIVNRKGTKNRKKVVTLDEEQILIDAAKSASSKAVRISKALGLTIKVIKDNAVVAISPDNTTQIVKTLTKSKIGLSGLKKGMTLGRK